MFKCWRRTDPVAIDHGSALRRLKALGWEPATVYDIGAYRGAWSAEAARIFPAAKFILFEANADNEPHLKACGFDFHLAALSAKDEPSKPLYLPKDVSTAGVSLYRENTEHYGDGKLTIRQVATHRLDTLAASHGMNPPDLIKIDVQGAELDVLAGAPSALAHCSALIAETSLLNYNAGAPLMADVASYLAARGMRCVDLCEVHRTPGGVVLQLDLLFVNDALYRRYYAAAGLT